MNKKVSEGDLVFVSNEDSKYFNMLFEVSHIDEDGYIHCSYFAPEGNSINEIFKECELEVHDEIIWGFLLELIV